MTRTTLFAALGTLMLAGCMTGDDTAARLPGDEWRIEDIAGRGVIDNSPASLVFLPDGQLAGNASCNRLIGSYEADGDALTLNLAGTTMMLCPDALMEQERRLLDLLANVKAYGIDDTDALILETSDGKTITARRL